MVYRLVEFEYIDVPRGAWEIASVKQIKNIFEHETREGLRRFARKNGIKVRGNPCIEITEIHNEYDCD
jgi:hypothetical protein